MHPRVNIKILKYIQLYCYNNINYNGITVWGLFDSGKAIWNRNHGTCMDYNNMHTDTYKLQHSAIKYKSVTHYQLCDTVHNNMGGGYGAATRGGD